MTVDFDPFSRDFFDDPLPTYARLREEAPPGVSTVRGDEDGSPLVTVDGDVIGTPAYMSPEQAKGESDVVGPASDIYAMGAILYELLTRRMPFVSADGEDSARQVLQAVQKGRLTPPRQIDPEIPQPDNQKQSP